MKIAIFLGAFSNGPRPLDFHYENIWTSTRGLTGTDLTTVMISKELAKKHDVHLFTMHAEPNNKPAVWEGVKLYNLQESHSVVDDTFDAMISINEPDVFRGLTSKPLRVCWQFLNDFVYCAPGFDDYVDKWLGVCDQHTDYLKAQMPRPEKWGTLALGCSPEWYEDKRVPGRVIWCSSADRGLHWLLMQWPEIKKAVPHASLRIFYHFNYGDLDKIEPYAQEHPQKIELANRIRYIKYAVPRLKSLDVQHVGSISRKQMQQEFSEASVFGFSCDTVAFSEGFSVSTLEAHASHTVPVITDKDCLGSVYKNSGAIIIQSPIKDHLQEFTDAVIKSLTDKAFADDVISKCTTFAKEHDWKIITSKLEDILRAGKS